MPSLLVLLVLLTVLGRSLASRSMVRPDDSGEAAWPYVVQPQPLYVDTPAGIAARAAAGDNQTALAALPSPLFLAADVLLVGACLKLISFNAAGAGLDHIFANLEGSSLQEHLRLDIPALGVAAAPLEAAYAAAAGSTDVPVLGVYCHAGLEDIVGSVNVSFTWRGYVPPAPVEGATPTPAGASRASTPSVAAQARSGKMSVDRVLPDVGREDDLGGGAAAPKVGLCAMFNLDAVVGTGWMQYWAALGVDQFILYYNGRFEALEEGESKHVRTLIELFPSGTTVVEWPFPYAIPSAGAGAPVEGLHKPSDYSYTAYPMAVNHCAASFGPAVDFLLFGDMKDFLVLPAAAARGEATPALLPRAPRQPRALQATLAALAAAHPAVELLSLSAFWAATAPSIVDTAAVDMGIDRQQAERVRGDLLTLRFLRGAATLRGEAPAPEIAKFALSRAGGARVGLLCARGPCPAAAGAPPAPPLQRLHASVADAYILRLANAGHPFRLGGEPAALAAALAAARTRDAAFAEHVLAASRAAGELRASATPLPPAAPGAACPSAAFAPAAPGALPPPVARLHAEITKAQMHSGCELEGRRFLAFTYSTEQAAAGFAAMFQFYAGALALAQATGRTLVELLPPPPANGSAAAGGPYSSEDSLLEAAAAQDPWRRAPARACHGAKMGCFLAPAAACGLTRVAAAALPQLDWKAEMGRAGRAGAAPHRRLPPAPEEAPGDAEAAKREDRERRRRWAAAYAPIVRLDSIEGARAALASATRGDLAPAWWAPEAAAWACGACASLEGAEAPACGAREAAARADHCAAYCAGGPALAARRLFFPSIEAWLFRPSPAIQAARGAELARVLAPPRALALRAPGAPAPGAPDADLPLGGRAALLDGAEVPPLSAPPPPAAAAVALDAAGGSAPAPAPAPAPEPEPHVAIALHYRSGDARGLLWRPHAPLTAYVSAAAALLRALNRRWAALSGELGPGAGGRPPHANSSLHATLVLATDSAAAARAAGAIVWDRLATLDSPIWQENATRLAPLNGSEPSIEPMLSQLQDGARRMIEADAHSRNVAGVLRQAQRAKLAPPPNAGGTWFSRLVLSQDPAHRLTKTREEVAAEEAAAAAAERAAAAANATTNATAEGAEGAPSGSASASAKPATATASASSAASAETPADNATAPAGNAAALEAPLPPLPDRVVHTEAYIEKLLRDARPRIASSADNSDDDVFPGKELSDARWVRLSADSFAGLPPALTAGKGSAARDEEAAAHAAVAALTEGVVGDIWLMSHANYIIGSCLSQVSRLAAELQLATGRARGPPVGLDAALCHAYPLAHPYAMLGDWRDAPHAEGWLGE